MHLPRHVVHAVASRGARRGHLLPPCLGLEQLSDVKSNGGFQRLGPVHVKRPSASDVTLSSAHSHLQPHNLDVRSLAEHVRKVRVGRRRLAGVRIGQDLVALDHPRFGHI